MEAGLNEALRLKQEKTQGTEGTTLVIYKGNYSAKEIASYKQRAEKSGITVVEVSYANEITNYVNEKEAQDTEEGKESSRSSDLINADFSYVGHGWTKVLYTGYNAIENDADYDALYTSTLNTVAFDLKCGVNLNACASGYDVMDDFVNRLTGGEVTGYTTTIMWGEKGLGSNRPYDKWYYPGTSYIDDFEGSVSVIDMPTQSLWLHSAVPQGLPALFPEGDLVGDLGAGFRRAQMSWYVIDPLFFRNNSNTPGTSPIVKRSGVTTASARYWSRRYSRTGSWPQVHPRTFRYWISRTIPVNVDRTTTIRT